MERLSEISEISVMTKNHLNQLDYNFVLAAYVVRTNIVASYSNQCAHDVKEFGQMIINTLLMYLT